MRDRGAATHHRERCHARVASPHNCVLVEYCTLYWYETLRSYMWEDARERGAESTWRLW